MTAYSFFSPPCLATPEVRHSRCLLTRGVCQYPMTQRRFFLHCQLHFLFKPSNAYVQDRNGTVVFQAFGGKTVELASLLPAVFSSLCFQGSIQVRSLGRSDRVRR